MLSDEYKVNLGRVLEGQGSITLLEDNREVFAAMPDETIDLILTDPPYKDYQSNRPTAREKVRKIAAADFDLPFFIEQSSRVLKAGCHFYCWCDHHTFPAIFQYIKELEHKLPLEKRLNYKNCLVWVKNNHGSGDLKGNYAPQYELVVFAVKGKGKKLNGRRKSNVLFKRTSKGNIEFYSKVSNYSYNHGTIKPVEILKMLIEASTEVQDLVFDAYAGVMSTAEACIKSGRRYLVVEIAEEHFKNGLARIRKIE